MLIIGANVLGQPTWVPTNGPFGGLVYDIIESPNGDLYSAAFGGGVFRSTNSGGTWTLAGLSGETVNCLLADSNGNVFAGTHGKGLFRSTDEGVSWHTKNTGLSDLYVQSLCRRFDGTLFLGALGVFRSVDNGESWVNVTTGELEGVSVLEVATNVLGHIFVGTYDLGIFKSTTLGDTWEHEFLLSGGISSILTSGPDTIFVGANGLAGFIKSTNHGDTWSVANNGLTNTYVRSMSLAAGNTILLGTNSGVFASTNGGDSWAKRSLSDSIVLSLCLTSSGLLIAGSTFGGIISSSDLGYNWNSMTNGHAGTIVRSLAIDIFRNIWAGTFSNGVFRSSDGGNSWIEMNSGVTNYTVWSLATSSSGLVFAGTDHGLFKSSNSGTSWTQSLYDVQRPEVKSIHIDSSGNLTVGTCLFVSGNIVVMGGRVYRSTDQGVSWDLKSSNLPDRTINSIASDNMGNLFAGLSTFGVYKSSNLGESWNPTEIDSVSILTVSFNSSQLFVGTTSKGSYRSSDNGDTWMPITGLNEQNAIVSRFKANQSGNWYAGTFSHGILSSTDGGNSWSPSNNGLPDSMMWAIAFDDLGYAYIGLDGQGVYRSLTTTTSVTEVNKNVPVDHQIVNVFPNPFNAETTIQFELKTAGSYKLELYDIAGRLVGSTMRSSLEPGIQRVKLDMKDRSSGTYFVVVRSATATKFGKAILQK